MVKQFPCVSCQVCVKNSDRALQCTGCKKWVHTKCTNVKDEVYDNPNYHFYNWKCSKCLFELLPFHESADFEGKDDNILYSSNSTNKPKRCSNINKRSSKNVCPNNDDDYRDKAIPQLIGRGIKFLQLNVVSLLKNIEELGQLLSLNSIGIFALNETRLDNSITDSEVNIPNYNIIRKDRDRRGGGICIYIHENILFEKLSLPNSVDSLEVLCIIIKVKNSRPIILVNWYRPPNVNNILTCYEELLIYLGGFHYPIILMGDTNYNIFKKTLNCDTRKYCELNDMCVSN